MGRAPDVQAAMSPVRAVSGGSGVVPDTVMGRALKSHARKLTPMVPSASRRFPGNRHPSAAPHLPPAKGFVQREGLGFDQCKGFNQRLHTHIPTRVIQCRTAIGGQRARPSTPICPRKHRPEHALRKAPLNTETLPVRVGLSRADLAGYCPYGVHRDTAQSSQYVLQCLLSGRPLFASHHGAEHLGTFRGPAFLD